MENILRLELLECLNCVIRQVGLILLIRLHVDRSKKFPGHQMVHYVLVLVEVVMWYLRRLLINNLTIVIGRLILMIKIVS